MAIPELEIPETLAFLQSAEPEALEQIAEQDVVEAFRSSAAEVPGYKDLLQKWKVDPTAVTDLASFRAHVPIVDKHVVFPPYSIEQLCRNRNIEDLKGVLPSSGHSGVFAFSVNTAKNVQNTAKMVDLALEYCLGISKRRALMVNTYPMGVNVHTALPVANTGVNADIALAIIKKFSPSFEQLILVGQPLFTKRLIEEGAEQGVDWAGIRASVVTGGEGNAESWRTYISRRVGLKDPDRPDGRFVASSMGIGELDLNLFHEVPDTIRIVRTAYHDRTLRYALFGEGVEVCPHFFMYYPMRTYIEEVPIPGSPVSELAVSMVSPDIRNPLIRYKTGDRIKIISYRTLERILAKHARPVPMPRLHMPIVAVFGRKETVQTRGGAIPAEVVKEGVYWEYDVASAITGFFKVRAVRGALKVELQLKPGVRPLRRFNRLLDDALKSCLPPRVAVQSEFFAHKDYPYSISYERKYLYIDRK